MDEHDPAIGIRDGLRYREYELTLSPGDMLFQYTDGVAEAMDTAPDICLAPDKRQIGGPGIHLVKVMMDGVRCACLGERNTLTVRRRI